MSAGPLDGVAELAAVVECGSFTAAARQLGVSKSCASKRVAELERRLGVLLLRRTTRWVRATPAGRHYAAACVEAVIRVRAAERAVRERYSAVDPRRSSRAFERAE